MSLTIKGVLLAGAFLVPLPNAHADSYIGVDGASISVENQLDNELNPHGMRLRLGMRLSDLLDMELHLGGGTDSSTPAFESFSATYVGAYLKVYSPFGQRSSLFGLAGVSGISYSQEVNGRTFTDSQSGFSYGFGMETQISDRLDLSADFMRYSNNGSEFSELSAISFGVKYYF
ncbi:MAG: outer membrane immunogenic protein [Granulosicoccus sp.]|jgi:outer membrane immunogenic protein